MKGFSYHGGALLEPLPLTRPVVGSSRNTRLAPATTPQAMCSCLRSLPDNPGSTRPPGRAPPTCGRHNNAGLVCTVVVLIVKHKQPLRIHMCVYCCMADRVVVQAAAADLQSERGT